MGRWKATPPIESFAQTEGKVLLLTLTNPIEEVIKFLLIIYDGKYSDDNKLIFLAQALPGNVRQQKVKFRSNLASMV